MRDQLRCNVTINPNANPTEWKQVQVSTEDLTLPKFQKLLANQFFDIPNPSILIFPCLTPISTEEQLHKTFNQESTESISFVIAPQEETPGESSLPLDQSKTTNGPSPEEFNSTQCDTTEYQLGENIRTCLDHFSINYQQCKTASDFVGVLPIAKLMVETQVMFKPKNPVFFYRRIRKIALFCNVSFQELVRELEELFEMCREERRKSGIPRQAESCPVVDHDPDVPVAQHNAACNACSSLITNIRYKCILCLDYDLCEECEAENMRNPFHDESHCFIKIHKPNVFSWKTVWLHRTQHLPPGAFSAIRGIWQGKNQPMPSSPSQCGSPSIADLERQIQILQNQLNLMKNQPQPGSTSQPTQQQRPNPNPSHPHGRFFGGVRSFFQAPHPSNSS